MSEQPVTLKYEAGTLILENAAEPPEHFQWDGRVDRYRALAMHYGSTVQYLRERGIAYRTQVPRYRALDLRLRWEFEPHYYQEEALQAWIEAGCRGSVVLPTGAGKTLLALKAIEHVARSTLVVVPTIDLMNQWYEALTSAFEVPIGLLGGGYHEVTDLTIATYDSAYLYCGEYGNCFGLLIFDEVHHLPAPTYSHIPQMSIATRRLGLTATYERLDGLHEVLEVLVGPVVYRKTVDDLRGEYLAEYETVRLYVELTPEERVEYEREYALYTSFIRERGLKLFGGGWMEFVRLSMKEREARRAMLAYNRAKAIALSAQAKMDLLESLLKQHARDRVIIFTENNDLVYRISQQYLIPAITHQTKTKERKAILDHFRTGEYSVLITS
ncbi:MAG TPA: DEAD/DEAH box helicase, partial [Armatimonadetes bacterium]|nr:DEAD/DEAH box helicase [Armatimonadota bacterium]